MTRENKKTSRGPMVHIRLNEKTHRNLKVLVAKSDTTIQQFVADLICREVVKPAIKSVNK